MKFFLNILPLLMLIIIPSLINIFLVKDYLIYNGLRPKDTNLIDIIAIGSYTIGLAVAQLSFKKE